MNIGLWGRKKNEARAMTDEIERATGGGQSVAFENMDANEVGVNQTDASMSMDGGLNSGEIGNADMNNAGHVTSGLRHTAFQGIGNVALGEMKGLEHGGELQEGMSGSDERSQKVSQMLAGDLPGDNQQKRGWGHSDSLNGGGSEDLEGPLGNGERMRENSTDSAGVFGGSLQGEKQTQEVSLSDSNSNFGERHAIFGTEQTAGDVLERGERQDLKVAESNARVKEMVAIENGYVQNGLEAGANVVGGESKKEIQERFKDDHEDLKVESGGGWAHDLLTKSQEGLTKEAVQQVDKIIKNNSYRPADLERERFLGMVAILRTYGRKFGERN